MDNTGDGTVDAATPLTVVPGTFTCCIACVTADAPPSPSGSAVRFPVRQSKCPASRERSGLPDRMGLASRGSFDGHPWLWLPIKNHGKDLCAILTYRPCTIGLTRRKLQRPQQVIAVCWHPPSGLGYCPRPSSRGRPASVAPGDFPAASLRLPHPFHNVSSALVRCSMVRSNARAYALVNLNLNLTQTANLIITVC